MGALVDVLTSHLAPIGGAFSVPFYKQSVLIPPPFPGVGAGLEGLH